MVDENRDFSSKAGRVRKKSAKILEMEELGEFAMLPDREMSSRFEMSWTDAGLDDVEYSQLLKEEDVDMDDQISYSSLRTSEAGSSDKKKEKTSKKIGSKQPQQQPQRKYYTAYKAWQTHVRSKETHQLKILSPVQLHKRLKEMWHAISKEEKIKWRKKAHVMSKNGEQLLEESASTEHPGDEIVKTSSTEAIDLAAHLRLLSESLNNIGTRLVEHKGKIAVQGSLSVLLDSLVCVLACLLGATSKIGGGVGERVEERVHEEILDDVAYILPGIS